MVVIGKGLGGGVFPLAALIAREHLNSAMPDRALGHYTHEKNPVACAAALATIEFIDETGLLDHVKELGAYTLERLRAIQAANPAIGDVRGLGLLIGVAIVEPETGKPAPAHAERILYAALSRGLSFKVSMGNVLTLAPALTITRAQMDVALGILAESLSAS
jgi:4-aminobutyrate aminotransferase